MTSDVNTVLEFRNKFKSKLTDEIKLIVDDRDVTRINHVDQYVMCFVHWRKGNVETATDLAIDVLKWRKDRNINDLTTESIDEELLKRGVIFAHGKAVDDTRIMYFVTRLQTKDVKPQIQKILCLWLERFQHQETGKHITFLLDVSKSNMSNVDLGGIKFLLECFTTYFPDMLERIIILEMPWIMNAIWKIVKQWMTEEQRRKTVFCNFKDLKQYISADNMLTYMGGEDTWEYKYPQPAGSVPSLEQQADFDRFSEANTYTVEIHRRTEGYIVRESEDEEMYVVEDVEVTTEAKVSSKATEQSEDARLILNSTIVNDEKLTSTTTYDPVRNNVEDSDEAQLRNGRVRVETSDGKGEPQQKAADASAVERQIKEETMNRSSSDRGLFAATGPLTTSMNETQKLSHSLLVMSPIAEIVFERKSKDAKLGRYQSTISLSNPNEDRSVAFKVKTNSPDRYHVKPSTGCVRPGERLTIRLNLSPGFEGSVNKDRFLILYQIKEDDSDINEFWKIHLPKEKRFEQRLRVRFDDDVTQVSSFNHRLPSPIKQPVSINPENKPSVEEQLQKLTVEITSLKAKYVLSERDSSTFRSKYDYFLFLQCVVILMLFYVIYKLSVVSNLVQLDQS